MIPLHAIAFALLTARPPQAEPAARPDAACVALVLPSAEGVDDAMAVAASVRSIFQSYLTGPSLKSVLLDARLPSHVPAQRSCFVLLPRPSQLAR